MLGKIKRYLELRWVRMYCNMFCDSVIMSFPRSGHTWLRVMLAKVISEQYNIPTMNLDLFKMAKKSGIPKIAVLHGVAPGFHINFDFKKMKFRGSYSTSPKVPKQRSLRNKKIIFLARDPRDVVVSFYHHLTRRNDLYDKSLSSFIREPYTLQKHITYLNQWAQQMEERPDKFLLLRYEDMQHNTAKELRRVVDFLGIPASDDLIQQAVQFGSVDNMRSLEKQNAFADYRLKAKSAHHNSRKVRKAKVGGYKEELEETDISYINEKIGQRLTPRFRY